MTSYFYEWLGIWKIYHEKNLLPYSKSYLEHPWKINKVFKIFDNIYSQKMNQRNK